MILKKFIEILQNMVLAPTEGEIGINPLNDLDKKPLTFGVYNGKTKLTTLWLSDASTTLKIE